VRSEAHSIGRRLERRLGIRAAGAVAALLAGGGYWIARLAGSRMLLLLVYGTAIVLAGSWLIGRHRPAITAERSQLPRRVREGASVEVSVTLSARRRVSTVILEEEMHTRLGGTVRVPLPLLQAGGQMTHTYTFMPRLRGVYRVGPLVATWSDPFGLTAHRLQLIDPAEIIVHPAVELVHDRVVTREWEDPPVRPPFSKPWPTGFEFYGMRDYVSGDDPRRIVWRAAARASETSGDVRLLVREAEQGITDRVCIVLDTDRRSHSPGEVSETFETAIRTVASIGTRHLDDGFAVTLDTNGGRIFEALRGRRNRVRFLDELARMQPESSSLRAAADRMLVGARRDLHTVIVTPHLDEDVAARLRPVVQRGVSLLVAIVVTDDSDPLSVHRAGALGCNVVEIFPGVPLEATFRRVLTGGRRR
jgi:uncharacterized protein (DUF58 family)